MYIRRFTYKKEDVDCKLCTEFRGRKKCPHKICPYITERIEAGAVTYQEAVNAMVHSGCQLIRRLPKLMQIYSGSFWLDDRHKSRMEFFNTRMGYSPSRNTPAYYAAMYLLTANETLYWRMANCFCRSPSRCLTCWTLWTGWKACAPMNTTRMRALSTKPKSRAIMGRG